MRSLDQLDVRLLTPASNNVRSPFVSPDGHWVGFFEGVIGGELKKVSILGGPPITLCKFDGNPREASWGPDDTIIFATSETSSGLLRVSAGGGDPTILTKPDRAHGEVDHYMPVILPGGRAVLFTILMDQQPIENAQIAVLDLKTGEKKILIRGGSDARYIDTGHLVYAVAGTMRAVRFDLRRLEVISDPVPIVEQVRMSDTTGTADFVIAENGTLVYSPGAIGGMTTRTLAWVDRSGREQAIKAPPRAYLVPSLSPDGARVALDIRDQDNDIWLLDFKRETLARLTFDPARDGSPIWSPDGRSIIFASARGDGRANLFRQPADGTGTVERLTTSSDQQLPSSISPDGLRILFTQSSAGSPSGVIAMLATGGTSLFRSQPLIQSKFLIRNAVISPDGRWVAYESNESGAFEVYVRPFPMADQGHWQVSAAGGSKPVWARSGREVFYINNSGDAFMAVPVQTTGTIFSAGTPVKLFDARPYFSASGQRTYDVSTDAQRFLLIRNNGASGQDTSDVPQLIVVEHWMEELKTKVPTK